VAYDMSAQRADGLIVRVPKTAELVAGHIRRQIVRGELQEDDALPSENALMEQFNISRPTLREAIRILESEGLIRVRRGARGGARVQVPSGDVAAHYAGLVLQHRGATLADVLEARVIVEVPAARMLASRRDRAKIADELQRCLDHEAADIHAAATPKIFNSLVVSLTENQTLILITGMLEYISERAGESYIQTGHRPQDERLARQGNRARAKLIELIRAGDADGAEDLWQRHLSQAGKALMETNGKAVVDLFG
jgi:GntR family transcriptional regulator, transcriptional repressor for pyruvate dehydrogenase complex